MTLHIERLHEHSKKCKVVDEYDVIWFIGTLQDCNKYKDKYDSKFRIGELPKSQTHST
jgi:hypothetical protein